MNNYRIVLCGYSVFLTAIESGLVELPGLEVTRLNPHLPAIVERIVALNPNLVMIERDGGYGNLALALLGRGLSLVELDGAGKRGVILSGCEVQVSNPEDISRLLAQIV